MKVHITYIYTTKHIFTLRYLIIYSEYTEYRTKQLALFKYVSGQVGGCLIHVYVTAGDEFNMCTKSHSSAADRDHECSSMNYLMIIRSTRIK